MKIIILCLFVVFCSLALVSCKYFKGGEEDKSGYIERTITIEKCTKNLENLYDTKYKKIAEKLRKNGVVYFMSHCLNLKVEFFNNEYKYLYHLINIFSPEGFFQFYKKVNLFKNIIKEKNKAIVSKYKEVFLHFKACYNLLKLSRYFFFQISESFHRKKGKKGSLFHQKNSNKQAEERMKRFYSWLSDNGVKFNKLDVLYNEADKKRSIYSLDDFQNNENLIYIPEKMIIFASNAEKSPIAKRLRRYADEIKTYETCVITLFLIEESMKKDSFWKPYIEVLPIDNNNFPIYFDDHELGLLKGYNLFNDIVEQRKNIRKIYEKYICNEELRSTSDFCNLVNYEIFLFTYITVRSRIFYFNREGFEEMALTPFADLMNHDNVDSVVNWRFSSNYNGFIIYATQDYSYGKELSINYGILDTETVFKYFGIIVDDDSKDIIYLDVGLDPSDKQFHLKHTVFKKKLLKNDQTLPLPKDLSYFRTTHFLNTFRFICYSDDLMNYLKTYFNFYTKRKEKKKSKDGVIHLKKKTDFDKNVLSVDYLYDNEQDDETFNFDPKKFAAADILEEIKMLMKLKDVLSKKLLSFNDEEAMEKIKFFYENNMLSLNEKNIYTYKLRQKKLLRFYIAFCDEMINMLKMNLEEFEIYYAENYERLKAYHYYIDNTVLFLLTVYSQVN